MKTLRAYNAVITAIPVDGIPDWIELLPNKGLVKTRDGRGPYYNNKPQSLVKAFDAFEMDLPGDFEHQSMDASKKSGPVIASGWIEKVEVREAGSVWGLVKWTEQSAKLISNREYRFISPVFDYNEKTGDIVQLVSFALTNNPNLFLRAAASQQGATMPGFIEKIKKAAENTDEAAAYKACKAEMAACAAEHPEYDEEDEGGGEAPRTASPVPVAAQDEMAAQSRAAAATQSGTVNLADYVPMSMYKALSDKVNAAEQQKLDDILEQACIDGRIVGDGPRRAFASMSKADPEGFKSTVAGLPKVFSSHSTTTASAPELTPEAAAKSLTAEERKVARAFHRTDLEYATLKLNNQKEAKDAAERGQDN